MGEHLIVPKKQWDIALRIWSTLLTNRAGSISILVIDVSY